MKNLTTTLTGLLTIIILSITSLTSFADDSIQITELANVKNITKIRVSGNVEVQLNQSSKESVTIYDAYYNDNALVQLEDGELRIASYGPEKLKVTVNVKSLNSIETNENAQIISSNQINATNLSVHLKGSSTVTLDAKTTAMETIADDTSNFTLTGSAKTHSIEISGTGKVDTTNFNAAKKTVKIEESGSIVTNNGGKIVIVQAPQAKI